ncbi:hypothetical protein ACXR0O_18725 [Verrucomicrobiota bacterium sgz303538]
MKFAFSLLVLAAVVSSFSACTTLSNRRDMYRPVVRTGPYTKTYVYERETEGVFGISQPNYHPRSESEGLFGVSNSDVRHRSKNDEFGIFGISQNVH